MNAGPDGQRPPVPSPDRSIRIEVPCDLAAMAAARAQVTEVAAAWGFPAVDELEVVMSELLTNAILHAGSAAHVQCSMDSAGAVAIAVTDAAPGPLAPQQVGEHATHGRGLAIVDAFSEQWGTIDRSDHGKTVWARLAARPLP